MRLTRIMTLMAAIVLMAMTAAGAGVQGISVQPEVGYRFIQGDLGHLELQNQKGMHAQGEPGSRWSAAARGFLRARGAELGAQGTEEWDSERVSFDDLGDVHIRMQQSIRGLPVVGGELIVHADATTGAIKVINGRMAPDFGLERHPRVDGSVAVEEAARQLGVASHEVVSAPELVYVINDKGRVYLAWKSRIEYVSDRGPEIDDIFASAVTGDLVARHPQVYYGLYRKTYSANNGSSLPGSLLFNEGGSSSDSTAMAAYNNAGTTYNYYSSKHSRDSYNGSGATITQTVHYSSNYNNAYWNGSQMVYGDGDGSTFAPLSKALDVVAHELTHAVTQYEANLTYSYESGALNEAMSDIFGAAAEAYSDGGVNSNTWKIGEDIYTPGTSGDALRYMNNPTADGSSYDYYPERYTGSGDNGGVHLNSGIANLSFYLMVNGGTHPRGKTSVSVPAIGMTRAEKIFYRALTVYMTSSTNFEGARSATAQAAKDLYGTTYEANVHKAWDAVGVPGGSAQVTALSNGQSVGNLSGGSGSWLYYVLSVPSGQTSLEIKTSGGSGDADLYVKRGALPTTSSYDYRPYKSGNNETVTVSSPASGDWYVGIRGYSSYSGVTLVGTYTPPSGGGGGGGGGGSCTSYTGSLSGTGQQSYQPNGTYYYSSTSGTHTASMTGPSSADFDLYLQKWNGSGWSNVAKSESSTSTESISYSGSSGYYVWRIYSYSGSGSYTICTTKP